MDDGHREYYERYWSGDIKGGILETPPTWDERNLMWHLDFFRPYIGRDVVDVGAGDGTFIHHLMMNMGCRVRSAVAVEVSEVAIALGTKKYPDVVFKKGEISSLQWCDDAVDTVIAIEVLEHILDIDLALDEIRRILHKGGHLCVTTTDFNMPKKIILACFFWDRFFYPNNPHVRFFTRRTLTEICGKHGLVPVDYKWNRSYFGLMPRGQMAVFQKA